MLQRSDASRAFIRQAPAPRPAAGGAGSDGEASDGGEDGEGEGGRAAPRQRPVGPPLELEAPLLPPPPPGVAPAMVRLSNILSVESRPFDPDTHSLEGEMFVDEAGNSQARNPRAIMQHTRDELLATLMPVD